MSMTFNERVQTVWKEKRPDIKSVRNLEERIGLTGGTSKCYYIDVFTPNAVNEQ